MIVLRHAWTNGGKPDRASDQAHPRVWRTAKRRQTGEEREMPNGVTADSGDHAAEIGVRLDLRGNWGQTRESRLENRV